MGETPERPEGVQPDPDGARPRPRPRDSVSDDPIADEVFEQMLNDAVHDTFPNHDKLRRRAANRVDVPEGAAFDAALKEVLEERSN